MNKKRISLVLQVLAAVIYLQTLYFKFSGAPESIYIFSTLGIEPVGRYFAGFSELVASVLLLTPGLAIFGAIMGVGIISGAILSHILFLGIEVQGDSGFLFGLACVILVCCLGVIFCRMDELKELKRRYAPFLPFPKN